MEVVINKCFGGFGISNECAVALGAKLIEIPELTGRFHHIFPNNKSDRDFRADPRLIALIKEKGSEWCSDSFSKLKIIEMPDDVEWEISDYDGMETIEEIHRLWG